MFAKPTASGRTILVTPGSCHLPSPSCLLLLVLFTLTIVCSPTLSLSLSLKPPEIINSFPLLVLLSPSPSRHVCRHTTPNEEMRLRLGNN